MAEGIIVLNEDSMEEEIRFKIPDSLKRKFELLSEDDFELVKVRHKIFIFFSNNKEQNIKTRS